MKRKGLVIIYTGNGKGKTTASLGMALRAVGQGMKVLMLQFVKSPEWNYGELVSAKRLAPDFELRALGEGFVGIMGDRQPREVHEQAAQKALKMAEEEIKQNRYDIIILDEILGAIAGNLIAREQAENLLKIKPEKLHLILTGRHAPQELINQADLVTEMKEIKHPFQKGIPAARGIDF